MKAEMQTLPKNFIAPAALAVLAGQVVLAVALQVELPVLSNAKAAFVTLAAIIFFKVCLKLYYRLALENRA
jgi:hypothetical protein